VCPQAVLLSHIWESLFRDPRCGIRVFWAGDAELSFETLGVDRASLAIVETKRGSVLWDGIRGKYLKVNSLSMHFSVVFLLTCCVS